MEGMGLSSLYEGTAPMKRGRGQTGRLKSFRAWGFSLHRCVQMLAKQLIISQCYNKMLCLCKNFDEFHIGKSMDWTLENLDKWLKVENNDKGLVLSAFQ